MSRDRGPRNLAPVHSVLCFGARPMVPDRRRFFRTSIGDLTHWDGAGAVPLDDSSVGSAQAKIRSQMKEIQKMINAIEGFAVLINVFIPGGKLTTIFPEGRRDEVISALARILMDRQLAVRYVKALRVHLDRDGSSSLPV